MRKVALRVWHSEFLFPAILQKPTYISKVYHFKLSAVIEQKYWVLTKQYLTFQNLLVTWCTNSLAFNNCTFCPHCVYVFCIYLRTNSDLCHLQRKLIGFYNRDEKCLLRGTNWVFKWSSLRFLFKGLISVGDATLAAAVKARHSCVQTHLSAG